MKSGADFGEDFWGNESVENRGACKFNDIENNVT